MGRRDDNYQIVYRGESLPHYTPGGWVFFQRPKKNGGGYWLGRTFDGVFVLEILEPVSLSQGIAYLLKLSAEIENHQQPDDNFCLF